MMTHEFMESAQKAKHRCYNIGRKAGCNKADIEELFNDVLRIALGKFSKLTRPEGYIVTVFYRRLRKLLKKNGQQQQGIEAFRNAMRTGLTEVTSFPELVFATQALIRRLEPKDMAVLQLVLIEDYPLQEAAQELGIKLEALKKRLSRAKERARALAEDLGLSFTAAASEPSLAA